MKRKIFICSIAAILFVTFSALAADKVVVIPLSSAKKLQNVVTVSAKGGDFTDPVAAINSITADADNPYLIVIGPGVYTLNETLIMKPYVSIAGSGDKATKLTGAISGTTSATSAIISGANNAVIRDLTIENLGSGSSFSSVIYNNSTSPHIQNVNISVSGGTTGSFAILNESSSPTMIDIIASATGVARNTGVYNESSSPTMTNVTIIASGGTVFNHGITIGGSSSPKMTNLTVTASGGTTNYGMENSSILPITMLQCTVEGSTNGINSGASGTTQVVRSSIIGGISGSGLGAITCINSDNGIDKLLDENCSEVPPPTP